MMPRCSARKPLALVDAVNVGCDQKRLLDLGGQREFVEPGPSKGRFLDLENVMFWGAIVLAMLSLFIGGAV